MGEPPCGLCGRDGCRLCWLYHHDPRYRQLWQGGTPAPAAPAAAPRPFCIHLGAVLNSLGCACSLKWVRECWKHDTCTLGDPSHGRACSTCPDYTTQAEEG